MDEGPAFDFVRFLELLVLVQDCRVAQAQLLADLLEFNLSVGVLLVLLEHPVHLFQLLHSDSCSNLALFLLRHALTPHWPLLRTLQLYAIDW